MTVQVGDFANFIGSHFWNFQDELLGLAEDPHGDPVYKSASLDMGVLYRAGETQQGTCTFNPRLISVGLQGSLGSLSSSGVLYNESASSSLPDTRTWTGSVSRHISEPYKKNLFLQSLYGEEPVKPVKLEDNSNNGSDMSQKQIGDKDRVESLENSVKFWTDYCKVYYHPRTLLQLYSSWADVQTFDNYGAGKDVLSDGLQGEEMNERLRFFVEDCDHIQGFQFIVDDSGGFSSVSAEILESIADEYTSTPVLLYTARDPGAYMHGVGRKNSISRALHDAISFSRLSPFCKLMVPVGLPSLSRSKLSSYLHVEDQKPFHCSAVYAASIHSISIPFRMELLGPTTNSSDISGAVDVGGIAQMLAGQARQNKVAVLDVAMPAPCLKDAQSQGSILRNLHSLTPEIEENGDDMHAVESLIIHGALRSGSNRASVPEVTESIVAEYEHELQKPIFSHLSVALSPLPIPLPFPSFFRNNVGRYGELSGPPTQESPPRGSLEVDSVPMAARLRSSKAIVPFIEKRLNSLRTKGIVRGAPGAELLRSWGFGKEEVEEMGELLVGMLKGFDPCSETSSDSDF